MIPLLRRLAVMDSPSERSSHCVPTPRGGGAPIAAALVWPSRCLPAATALPFAAAVAPSGLIGLATTCAGCPRAPIGWSMQAVAGLAHRRAAGPGRRACRPAAGRARRGRAAPCWLTGFVNAFNFMDGVNGISGAHAHGRRAPATLPGRAGGRTASRRGWCGGGRQRGGLPALERRPRPGLPRRRGQLRPGRRPRRAGRRRRLRGVPPEAALGPLALYLADTAWTLQRRIRAGERWLEAHRTHAYQRLCDVGWSHQQVTLAAGGRP